METLREMRMRKKRERQQSYLDKYGGDIAKGNVPTYAQYVRSKKYKTVRTKAFESPLKSSGLTEQELYRLRKSK